MLLSGDELGRTQKGNNNAYCQDNELSWLDWDLQESNESLLDFTRQLIYFRRQHPVFRRRKWFQGRAIRGSDASDITWFNPRRHANDRGAVECRVYQSDRHFPQRRSDSHARTAGENG